MGGVFHCVNNRNYVDEVYRNALKQFPKLSDVQFYRCEYYNLKIPHHSIVYCDPPYAGAAKYSHSFDSFYFWEWSKNVKTTLGKNKSKNATERLYRFKKRIKA